MAWYGFEGKARLHEDHMNGRPATIVKTQGVTEVVRPKITTDRYVGGYKRRNNLRDTLDKLGKVKDFLDQDQTDTIVPGTLSRPGSNLATRPSWPQLPNFGTRPNWPSSQDIAPDRSVEEGRDQMSTSLLLDKLDGVNLQDNPERSSPRHNNLDGSHERSDSNVIKPTNYNTTTMYALTEDHSKQPSKLINNGNNHSPNEDKSQKVKESDQRPNWPSRKGHDDNGNNRGMSPNKSNKYKFENPKSNGGQIRKEDDKEIPDFNNQKSSAPTEDTATVRSTHDLPKKVEDSYKKPSNVWQVQDDVDSKSSIAPTTNVSNKVGQTKLNFNNGGWREVSSSPLGPSTRPDRPSNHDDSPPTSSQNTELSASNLATSPNWPSQNDSPKFLENGSDQTNTSPMRNKLEELILGNNQGSNPYPNKNVDNERSFSVIKPTNYRDTTIDAPRDDLFKQSYAVNNNSSNEDNFDKVKESDQRPNWPNRKEQHDNENTNKTTLYEDNKAKLERPSISNGGHIKKEKREIADFNNKRSITQDQHDESKKNNVAPRTYVSNSAGIAKPNISNGWHDYYNRTLRQNVNNPQGGRNYNSTQRWKEITPNPPPEVHYGGVYPNIRPVYRRAVIDCKRAAEKYNGMLLPDN